MHPYLIDENLEPKKNQPDFVENGSHTNKFLNNGDDLEMDWLTANVCRNGSIFPPVVYKKNHGKECRFLHHQNPYLKLGPFKEELVAEKPYAVIFRDLLSDTEINYLIETANPNLSRSRDYSVANSGATTKSERKSQGKTIHKTVQAWIQEVSWPLVTNIDNHLGEKYPEMLHEILWKLAGKIALATQLKTQSHFSSSRMQVTNYGLAGLCENHVDPHGIEERKIPRHRQDLPIIGDMIGTLMAWLSETEAGGATVFLSPGYEALMMPERGSAGFWYNLDSSLYRDSKSKHAGCPVIKGSKWIVNKWMYAYDNFSKFRCKLEKFALFDAPSKSHYF